MGDNERQSNEESVNDKLRSVVPNASPQSNFEVKTPTLEPQKYSDVNAEMLLSKLSPQLTENEKNKRIHKHWLIGLLSFFIVFQFITVSVLSYMVVNYGITQNVNLEILKSLFTFITGYITSVIIELITILNYIVKNVFDKSIYDLVKLFKDNKIDDN